MTYGNTASFGTITGSNYGFTISPTTAETKPKAPAGLVVTQAVQTKEGWLGQVVVDKEIVWESEAYDDSEDAIQDAIQDANAQVVDVFKALFARRAGRKKPVR